MAVVHPQKMARTAPRAVDIAGTAWPVFKLEALGLGLAALLVLALVTGSAQLAVLAAATVAALRWMVGLARG
ncbi:hypothetical protein JK358_25980 [Nocardia sp. 2]|uniref:Uncharacterized protein n=1 Tax=Nocardia acididurans TaxID=2802282 RepID=A0ABS1MF87_9NOCA|nr:hypothetical protein [Nocardia acididurans]MBL1077858.1 hypothetical protein [Nocardia acididurans]